MTSSFGTQEPTGRAVEVLRSVGVSRNFPGVRALHDVTFGVRPGEVHALVGENGAGKSTLVKILSGVDHPTTGHVEVRGHEVGDWDASHALHAGVRTIFQEFNLVPQLTVMENICLGAEPTRGMGVLRDRKGIERAAGEALHKLDVNIDLRRRVESLGVAEQQLVEIAKALNFHGDPAVLILDEPTAALSNRESDRLFEVVRSLAAQGIGMVYITHRFDEFNEIGDRVTVMRDGAVVATRPMDSVSRKELVALMVGEQQAQSLRDRERVPVAERLGTTALRAKSVMRRGAFGPVDLSLRSGEVLGVFGLVGAGRTELARALVGADRLEGGSVELLGKPVRVRNTSTLARLGFGLAPEDRKKQGIIPDASVLTNLTLTSLPKFSRWGVFLCSSTMREAGADYVSRLRIKTPTLDTRIKNLSGGNQQKVVLARLLCAGTKVIIFDEPTRGIDVGAKREVYDLIHELAEDGHALMVISSELDEVVEVSDRIVVMREGLLSESLDPGTTSKEELLHLAFPEDSESRAG